MLNSRSAVWRSVGLRSLGCAGLAAMLAQTAGCHPAPPPQPAPQPLTVQPPPKPAPAPSGTPLATSQPTTAPVSPDAQPVATVDGITITRQDLYQPLVEAYGLNMLQNVMLVKLAEQLAAKQHVTVTPADIRAERQQMLANLFPDAPASDDETLLDQMLKQQNITRTQFDMALETNADLRKIVEPHIPTFDDKALRQAFGRFYGENRQISDIEVPNMRDAAEVKRRLNNGEPFGQVASLMSDDPRTKYSGGELPAFSAQSPNMPQAIKDAAFSLQVGQVSDVIQDGPSYHVIKLDRIIPPKVVRFEDVRASVEKTLQDSWVRLAIKRLRDQLSEIAIRTIHIDDPQLQAQWQQRVDQQQNRQHDRDMLREELNRMHPTTTAPTTAP